MVRVPAKSLEAARRQCGDILALSTAVIKNRAIGDNNTKSHHKLHRLRKVPAHDSRPVPSDFHMLLVGGGCDGRADEAGIGLV